MEIRDENTNRKFLNKRLKELGIKQVLEYLVILISHTLSKLKNLMISNLLVTVMNLMLLMQRTVIQK